VLSQVDLFAALPPEALRALAEATASRPYGRGERVIAEGSDGHTFYVVAGGEVSVRTGAPAVEIARLRRGQYFGEMSLLTGEPRSATVVATEDSVLLEIDRATFARIFQMLPGLARQLSAQLAHRRSQLRAVAEVSAAPDTAPEEGRIFTRLRQIFRLSQD
jgi:CRP-like cAMP-binding protein